VYVRPGVGSTYARSRYMLYPMTPLLLDARQASETLDAVAAVTRRLVGGFSALREGSLAASASGVARKSKAAAATNAPLTTGLRIGSPSLFGG
jgi:hypothetical protein